jgi:ATP-dependent DNA helicase RecQ
VTLLYDPQDRALQEFFIANSVIATNDLHALHNAIHNGEQTWVTLDDLSRVTGLHPVQVKVGLAELERAGALAHLGDEGFRILFRRGAWNQDEIEKVAIHSKEHINHRRAQLERIVQYAESNSCRRKIILNYFGDTGEAQIEDCCDNCQGARVGQVLGKEPGEMSHGERAALIILDCIRRVHIKVGQEKLAQILHGSKARAILKFHHDKNEYYGRLAGLRLNEIKGMISKLIEMGYIKIIGSRLPTLRLTPRGENAVNQRDVISIEIPKFFETSEKIRARAKFSQKGGVEDTAKLLICGLQPKEIAEKRGLATTTIYDHLAQLIAGGRISVDQVVPKDILP